MSTKQNRIAEIAKKYQDKPLVTLHHHIDLEWMKAAYKKIKPTTSAGVDGQTLEMYGENLEHNLQDIRERAISGRYIAPPVKRVSIFQREMGRNSDPSAYPR